MNTRVQKISCTVSHVRGLPDLVVFPQIFWGLLLGVIHTHFHLENSIPFWQHSRAKFTTARVPLTMARVSSTHDIAQAAGGELTVSTFTPHVSVLMNVGSLKTFGHLLLNVRARPKSAKLEASLSRKVLFEQRPKAITSPWSVFQKPNKMSCSGDVP